MAKPFLLAETPRAGELNHRFICSPGAGLTDESAREFVAAVLHDAGMAANPVVGRDFIAVIRRGVFQTNSDRKGDEVLVLGGVDPRRLHPSVAVNLEDLLGRMGEIIPSVAQMKGLLVELPEFASWLSTLMSQPPQVNTSEAHPSNYSWIAGALMAVAVAGGVVYYFTRDSHSDSPPPSDSRPAHERVEGKNSSASQPTTEEYLDELRVTLSGADKSSLQKDIEAVVGKNWKSELPTLAAELKSSNQIDVFRYRGGNTLGLLQLLPTGKATCDDARQLRMYLAEWHKHLKEIRALAKASGLAKMRTQLAEQPTLALLADLAANDAYRVFDEVESLGPSVLPWFDSVDEEIATALNRLFVQEESGIEFANKRLNLKMPTLKTTLLGLHREARDILKKLGSEKRSFEDLKKPSPGVKNLTNIERETRNYQMLLLKFSEFMDKLRSELSPPRILEM